MSTRKLPALPVIFRAEKRGPHKGEVTAVFPTRPGNLNAYTFTVYSHTGQHGVGLCSWYQQTRKATPEEYAPLLRELSALYSTGDDPVQLRIVSRMISAHWAQRNAILEALCLQPVRKGFKEF